ncbi:hypothetical protein CROQUDRAFT_655759 [Cronartium quercuum f. sp. fusiforme G11]|uniref:Uncharacterized protein n=1 Tax=Cronartium quercuum f. sp. fusiforme G11 TaxID=708437 RepID=A0A9P6TDJ4_9BASI|nr:hypothetical protein CROQUDRAFT_655759 [Cronartium quercuum f. sp. fusiforme G11]
MSPDRHSRTSNGENHQAIFISHPYLQARAQPATPNPYVNAFRSRLDPYQPPVASSSLQEPRGLYQNSPARGSTHYSDAFEGGDFLIPIRVI